MSKTIKVARWILGFLFTATAIYAIAKWTSEGILQGLLVVITLLLGGLIIGIRETDSYLPRWWWAVRFAVVTIVILLGFAPSVSKCVSSLVFIVLGALLLVIEDKIRLSG